MLSRLLNKPRHVGPLCAKKPYIVGEQLEFYQRLRHALPNCTFVPNISLADLVKPLAEDVRLLRQQQEKITARRLAYGVFNDVLELLCVIELSRTGGPQEERSLTLSFLEDAGIPCFSFEFDQLPSTDQILRAMAAYTTIVPSRFAPAANSVIAPDSLTWESVMDAQGPAVFSLSVDAIYRLTPNGHVRSLYPHIWERISLFCNEPRHLEQYLSSLSLQDRGGKRGGFPEGVIVELAELQGANARFIPAEPRARGGWNDVFVNR